MINKDIEVILFDWGGTLVDRTTPVEEGRKAYEKILKILDSTESVESIKSKLKKNFAEYKDWAIKCLIEVPEEVLMVKWLFKDYPLETVLRNEKELFVLFQYALGPRTTRKGVKDTLSKIKKMGYRMGLVSNHIGRTMVLDELKSFNIDQYMESRIISSLEGMRKPDPKLFSKATSEMNISPEKCIYVGDNPSRDVIGARLAGIRDVVLVKSDASGNLDNLRADLVPDLIIENISDILKYLPGRNL